MEPSKGKSDQNVTGYNCRFGVESCGNNSQYCERYNEEFEQFIEFLNPGCDHEFPSNTEMPKRRK